MHTKKTYVKENVNSYYENIRRNSEELKKLF